MDLKVIIRLFFYLAVISPVFAQQIELDISHLTTSNGLSNNTVNSVAQDSTGFLWFGTEDGLNRYDGYEIKQYSYLPGDESSLQGNFIVYLFVDKSNRLWVGSRSGLDLYDRINNNFTRIASNLHVFSIKQSQTGVLWITTKTGVYKIFENSLKLQKSHVIITNHVNTNKELHFVNSTEKIEIAVIKNNEIRIYEEFKDSLQIKKKVQAPLLNTNYFSSEIYYVKEEDYYLINVNVEKEFLFSKTGSNYYFNPIIKNRGVADHYAYTYENYDWKSNINDDLIRVPNVGIALVNDNGYSIISNKNGLAGKVFNSLFYEKSGLIIIPSLYNGVNLLSIKKNFFKTASYQEINGEYEELSEVYSVQLHDDKLFLGTFQGLITLTQNSYDNKIFFNTPSKKVLNSNLIRVIKKFRDGLLIGYQLDGLSYFDLKTRKNTNLNYLLKRFGFSGIKVTDIEVDDEGNIWLSMFLEGVVKISNDLKKVKLYNFRPGIKTDIDNIARDIITDSNGMVWIAGGKYLNYYDKDSDQIKRISLETNEMEEKLLGGSHSLCEDRFGNIWIGTFHNGLFVFYRESGLIKSWDTRDGLPNNIVNKIIEDNDGYLWISTNNGLTKFDPSNETFENYYKKDGLQDNEFYFNSGFKDNDGNLYFGGSKGLSFFEPGKVKRNNFFPPIVFVEFKINNIPVQLVPNISIAEKVELDYNQSFISITYAALNYYKSEYNSYRYKLEGFNEEWIDAGNNRTAVFTNLSPGEYTLKVMGSNNDGVWNPNEKSLSIIVNPPFWMTVWFRTIIGLLIIGAIYYIYRLRIRSYQLVEETRSRIAENLHDEFGGKLSGIYFLASNLKNLIGNEKLTPDSRTYIDKICEESNKINDGLRDVVWSLNPENDSWDLLIINFRRFASDLLDNFNIEYKFEIDEKLPSKELNAEKKINFLMLLKEAVNNVVKHSQCSMVNIKISVVDGFVIASVKDNGIGFDTEKDYAGSGLKTIKKRVKILNAEYRLSSHANEGTEIFLKFRVN